MNTTPTLKRLFISWEQLHRDARALAGKLQEIGTCAGIVAVARGGLVPATIIARELGIAMFETIIVEGYHYGAGDHAAQAEPKILKSPAIGDGAGWLMIDDLVTTGRTAEMLRKLLPKAHFAAVYTKPMGKPLIDTFVTEVSQDTWIYLPWYDELQFKHPISMQPLSSGIGKQ